MKTPGACAWCQKRFWYELSGPDAFPKFYCTKNHQQCAVAASKRFLSHFAEGECPTPSKKRYLTVSAAMDVFRCSPTVHMGMRVYLCTCGFHHIGHVRKGCHSKEQMERGIRERENHAATIARIAQAADHG